jgi:YVTN family beta-propeller protein
MHRKNSKECCALWVRGFAALWAVLVPAEAFSIRTAVAQPFAFVTTVETNEFAMVDTATGRVVAMIPQDGPLPAAVTPDGKHAYVAENTNKVLVIDTATKNVVARIRVGEGPEGVAISLDGNHAFVLNRISRTISVIATATNRVTETVPTGDEIDFEDQIGADGKHIFSIK